MVRDETRLSAFAWQLTDAIPLKVTGPTLGGGGADVAIEEGVLSCGRRDQLSINCD